MSNMAGNWFFCRANHAKYAMPPKRCLSNEAEFQGHFGKVGELPSFTPSQTRYQTALRPEHSSISQIVSLAATASSSVPWQAAVLCVRKRHYNQHRFTEILLTSMAANSFIDRLANRTRELCSPVVVGLDPRWRQLPESLRAGGDDSREAKGAAYARFCNGVSDVVARLVPAVKVQAAFFEELGPPGMDAMAEAIAHAQARGLLVILDGKRNDIGSTAEAYARAYLGRDSAWQTDALTVSPYLGDDSLVPFVETARRTHTGIFVLVKTSNPGGGMLQDLTCDGRTVYGRVAAHVETLAAQSAGDCGYGAVGAVVGATYPAQLAELRKAMPHTWFLVPGYGSQGGTAADVAAAFDDRGLGAIVNNSRGIIFAHERPEYASRFGPARWQDAVEAATRQMIAELAAVVSFK
jgi:orotidine-5'-phosphate decarboxylase